jgi:xylose isomerase
MKGYSVGVWTYGMGSERYVGSGYKPYRPLAERIARIAQLKGVDAVEVTFPNDVNAASLEEFRALIQHHGLKVAALGVELVCDAEWRDGSFSSTDAARRAKSIQLTTEAMDLAAELDVEVLNLWLGQDGFDYVFQADYPAAWGHLVAGLRTCASHRSDIKLGVEYKVSEPKMNGYINSGGKALALALATGMPNVGVTLDVGHALNARENPAEIAAVLQREGRLFHLHLNDNYGFSDDDMPVGTVHWAQFVELLHWLHATGYAGWHSLDLYPYRDDAGAACEASLDFLQRIQAVVSRPGFAAALPGLRQQAPGRVLQWLFAQTLKD